MIPSITTNAVPVTTYLGNGWQPDHQSILAITLPTSPVDVQTPSDVMDWLMLPTFEQSADSLEFIALLNELPHQTIENWTMDALSSSMPTLPNLPPMTIDDLTGQWFVKDVFGVAEMLGQRYLHAEVDTPDYGLGANAEWLFPMGVPYTYGP